jgi:hypothetical protein
MKRTLTAIAILFMLAGCATSQLPATASPEQVRAAHCQDAVTGVAIANVWLTTKQMTVEESRYWVAYQESAKLLVAQYCMGAL